MHLNRFAGEAPAYAVPPVPVVTRTTFGPVEHTRAGTGPAFLALHGGMGGYDQSWLLARALLADLSNHNVLGLSRPGYLGTRGGRRRFGWWSVGHSIRPAPSRPLRTPHPGFNCHGSLGNRPGLPRAFAQDGLARPGTRVDPTDAAACPEQPDGQRRAQHA